MYNVANAVLGEPRLGFEPRCATTVWWQDRRNISVPVFRAHFAGYCGCCHAFNLKKPWWLSAVTISREFTSYIAISYVVASQSLYRCTSRMYHCHSLHLPHHLSCLLYGPNYTVFSRVLMVARCTIWCVCVRNKIYVTSFSALRFIKLRFLKIYVIQGEHKVFPWLQTLIARKLRGVQTYIFF